MTRPLSAHEPRAGGDLRAIPALSSHGPHRVPPARLAEYHSMARDGIMRPLVGDVWVAAEVTDSARLRADAIALLLTSAPRPRPVVGGHAAAWIMLGGPEPTHIDVLLPTGVRRRLPSPLRAREVHLDDDEQLDYAGLVLTTPVRTAVDLACSCAPEQARTWLLRLEQVGAGPEEVARALAHRRGHRGIRRARAALASHTSAAVRDR
jgi:hypothetical protein